MRVLLQGRQTLVRQGQAEGQGGVGQGLGTGARRRAGHVGDAVVDHAVDDIGRVFVGRRLRGLEAAALVDGHVDQDAARPHGFQLIAADQGRGLGAGDQDRPDHHVGLDQFLLDGADGGIAGDDPPAGQFVDLAHPGDGPFQHHHLGAQAHGHARGVQPHDPAAQHQHSCGGHARHAAEQQAHAAVVLQQGLGGGEDGDPSGHLGHGRQQGQAAVPVGHRLIGDGGAFRGQQALGLLGIGRQMQIGEEDMVFAQPRPFDGLRLLDLHDHVAVVEDGFGVGDDGRARLDVVGVGEARAQSGAGLDTDLMAMGDVFARSGRGQAYAMFVGLDFAGYADAHGSGS
ncbi:hypothetical protein D3C72_1061310 [compost metagenome]